jgi:thymidylate synthase (FAD)
MQILDNGYVRLVESWGSDERIVEAARMSTQKGFNGWGTSEQPGDEKLLCYLWTHKHATPFEMAGMVVEVKAPIFVFREWHRHRTQSYSEMSARYAPLPDENYLPTVERIVDGAALAGKNKQAAATGIAATGADAQQWLAELRLLYKHAQQVYDLGLKLGVPKEIARLPCPVARYSKMRASANLRNWLQFLTLRMNVAAQWEIRQYANAVGQLIQKVFPRTWELYAEERK